MADEFGEKTQEATPYRRQRAREEGHVARSQDLASAVLLVAGVWLLSSWGPKLVTFFASFLEEQLSGATLETPSIDSFVGQAHRLGAQLAVALLPILGLLLLASILVHVLQVGFLFVPDKLALDLSRIDPLAGLRRLVDPSSAVRLLFGLGKVALLVAVAAGSLWAQRQKLTDLTDLDLAETTAAIVGLTLKVSLHVALALLVLALLDFGFQRWKYERDLRMTPQEVREEFKTLQGDPQLVARRRQVQRQMALHRLAAIVPQADVVVTNPTEIAVALRYDPRTMMAPIVTAKGAGLLAQRIRNLAIEHGVPVLERRPLARSLYQHVELNHPIPAEHYAAVAEILRYVYELQGKKLPDLGSAA